MRIELPSGTPAEVALPSSSPSRGVVIAPDIHGLRPLFDAMCDRLMEEHGWAVCAVEPFPGHEEATLEHRFELMASLDDDRQIADLVAGADHLGVEPVAVIGFCMGGMFAMKASGSGRFDRAVAFYGMIRVPDTWRGSRTGEPLDHLRRRPAGGCPVLAVIGAEDMWTPPEHVQELRDVPDVEVVVYPHAEHGFVHDPERPAHRADDATDAWARASAFLGE